MNILEKILFSTILSIFIFTGTSFAEEANLSEVIIQETLPTDPSLMEVEPVPVKEPVIINNEDTISMIEPVTKPIEEPLPIKEELSEKIDVPPSDITIEDSLPVKEDIDMIKRDTVSNDDIIPEGEQIYTIQTLNGENPEMMEAPVMAQTGMSDNNSPTSVSEPFASLAVLGALGAVMLTRRKKS